MIDFCPVLSSKAPDLGAVTIRIPSELKLDTTLSGSQSEGNVHLRENCLMTLEEQAESASFSCFSSACLPSMLRVLFMTVTFNSSGLYWGTSRVTSNLFGFSLTLIIWKWKKKDSDLFYNEYNVQTQLIFEFVSRRYDFFTNYIWKNSKQSKIF